MRISNKLGFLGIFLVAILAMSVSINAQNARIEGMIEKIEAEYPTHEATVKEGCDGAVVKFEVDFASFGDKFEALQQVPLDGLYESAYGFKRFCTSSEEGGTFDAANVRAVKRKVAIIRIKQVDDSSKKKVSLIPGNIVLIEMNFNDFNSSNGSFEGRQIEDELKKIL
jgi:hypothetical protein